jgi:hypothetical protein
VVRGSIPPAPGASPERHEQGRGPHPDEGADVGLEPDLEQQDEDSGATLLMPSTGGLAWSGFACATGH